MHTRSRYTLNKNGKLFKVLINKKLGNEEDKK